MSTLGVSDWLDEALRNGAVMCAKRLAYVDVCADDDLPGSIHLPEVLLHSLVPQHLIRENESSVSVALCDRSGKAAVGTLGWRQLARVQGARHELRMGVRSDSGSPLRDPANVGALAIFAFSRSQSRVQCGYLVCGSVDDDEQAEVCLGPVEPGFAVVRGMHVSRAHGGSGLPGSLPTEIPVAFW